MFVLLKKDDKKKIEKELFILEIKKNLKHKLLTSRNTLLDTTVSELVFPPYPVTGISFREDITARSIGSTI